ncbi:MAG: CDP-diacylglycerol--glycerol-3-phosphate 3-phosphatidyltransferase [Candidatus Sericytochromatia bacterium]|nr:CDP-diacylglycerol--glycerol-3-phosphate 3-phosphatidyltransferase [Candidatus Tanganyikabacteria bacterium]
MNLPTALTWLRVALIVPLAWAFEATPVGTAAAGREWAWIAFGCYVVASVTDYFDGMLARRWGQTTTLGALLDPLADKVLVACALVGLAYHGVVPAWTVTLIVAREFLVTGLRVAVAEKGGGVTPASWPGKVKTVLQMVALALYLWPPGGIKWAADPVYALALLLTVSSGAEYVWKSRHVLK